MSLPTSDFNPLQHSASNFSRVIVKGWGLAKMQLYLFQEPLEKVDYFTITLFNIELDSTKTRLYQTKSKSWEDIYVSPWSGVEGALG